MKPDSTEEAHEAVQKLPFSERLLELYQEFQSANKERRVELAHEIAEAFMVDHDSTDHGATDDYHQYFEAYEEARLKFEHASLRVTRLVVHVIEQYLTSNQIQLGEEEPDIADQTTN